MSTDSALQFILLIAVVFAGLYVFHVIASGMMESLAKDDTDKPYLIRSVDDRLDVLSTFTAEQLDKALMGIGAESMVGLGEAFVQAELRYDVNAVFLTAVAVHESGKGTSRLAHEKNNLFGWGAVDVDPFVRASTFDSLEDGIEVVAAWLRAKYFVEWDARTLRSVGSRYATDPQWDEKVLYWVKRLQEEGM